MLGFGAVVHETIEESDSRRLRIGVVLPCLMRLGRATIAIVVVLVAAATGCSDEKSISKDDFLKRANARCAELNDTLADSERAIGADPTEAQVIRFITEVLVPALDSTVDDIRDLGFPDGDAELLEGLMDETDRVLETLREDPGSAFSAEESPFTSINARLADYGLDVCADEG